MSTWFSNIEFINNSLEDESGILNSVDKNASANALSFEQVALEMGFDPKTISNKERRKVRHRLACRTASFNFQVAMEERKRADEAEKTIQDLQEKLRVKELELENQILKSKMQISNDEHSAHSSTLAPRAVLSKGIRVWNKLDIAEYKAFQNEVRTETLNNKHLEIRAINFTSLEILASLAPRFSNSG